MRVESTRIRVESTRMRVESTRMRVESALCVALLPCRTAFQFNTRDNHYHSDSDDRDITLDDC
jgi:hypothetical protein